MRALAPQRAGPQAMVMSKILIDTCVWLDLAKDHQRQAVLGVLEEPRRLGEISDAIGALLDKIWYNRHQVLLEKIESREIKLVEKETPEDRRGTERTCQRDIWEGARKSACKVEKRYGLGNLGPWDELRMGNDERQAFCTPMGTRRRLGHVGYVATMAKKQTLMPASRRFRDTVRQMIARI